MKLLQLTLGFLLMSTIVYGQSESNQDNNAHQKQKNMSKEKTDSNVEFSEMDLKFLKQCLSLAEEALNAGDQPFGSILVNANNEVIAEARNRINEKNVLAHPEIELAEWAMKNLSREERREAKMYTTGEHCPMCAGAHAWSEIGSLYYLSSAKQLGKWLTEFDVDPAPIVFIPADEIMKNVEVKGPANNEMLLEIKELHKRYYQKVK